MGKSSFRLSILTPTRTDVDIAHLEQAWQSILSLDDSINWEWVVQIDGEGGDLLEKIKKMTRGYPVLHGDYDRSYGAAVARNVALALSGGNWVLALDSDDWLLPDGVLKQSAIAKQGSYRWITGPAQRAFSDNIEPRPSPFAEGEIPVGAVSRERDLADGKMPVLATPIMYQKDLAMYFGGWPALPRSEDVGLLYAVNSLEPGFMTNVPFYVYRKWPGQTTFAGPEPRIRKAVLRHRAHWSDSLGKNQF